MIEENQKIMNTKNKMIENEQPATDPKGKFLGIAELTEKGLEDEHLEIGLAQKWWSDQETLQLIGKLKQIKVSQLDADERKEVVITETELWVAIMLLLQKGATFKKARGGDYIEVKGTPYTIQEVREALKRTKIKKTLRQLAKTYADDIAKVSNKYNQVGNLAPTLITPETSPEVKELAYWMSDFQADNPNCPDVVKMMVWKQMKKRSTNSPS